MNTTVKKILKALYVGLAVVALAGSVMAAKSTPQGDVNSDNGCPPEWAEFC